jgi:hypothetical protein
MVGTIPILQGLEPLFQNLRIGREGLAGPVQGLVEPAHTDVAIRHACRGLEDQRLLGRIGGEDLLIKTDGLGVVGRLAVLDAIGATLQLCHAKQNVQALLPVRLGGQRLLIEFQSPTLAGVRLGSIATVVLLRLLDQLGCRLGTYFTRRPCRGQGQHEDRRDSSR